MPQPTVIRQVKALRGELRGAAVEARRVRQALPRGGARRELADLTVTLQAVVRRLPTQSFRARARREGL